MVPIPSASRLAAQGKHVNTMAYRPEIDGLRALAVLSVVFYHADLGLSAGFVGVDVFFVISGYIITTLLVAETRATGRIDLLAFYARRFRRIFPALVVVVSTTLLASSLMLSPYGEVLHVAESAAASMLMVGNIYFQLNSGRYFDPDADRLPLLHLWSLGVEEQFYLVWPLALTWLLRRHSHNALRLVGLTALASLASTELLMLLRPQAAFYQMPARFWELALGGLIALSPIVSPPAGSRIATVGMLLIVAATALRAPHFPGVGALPVTAGTGLVLLASHRAANFGWLGAVLRSRPLVQVGLLSYSLYLWHWPLLALARATHPGELPLSMRIALCVSALLLSWLSFRFIERPFRRPDPATGPRQIVAAGLLACCCLAYAAITLGRLIDRPALPTDLASRTARDGPANRHQCNYRGDEPLDSLPRPGCLHGAGKPVKLAIWGDSHALAWQPFAWALADSQGVASTAFVRDACRPALGYRIDKPLLEERRCRQFNELVVKNLDGIETLVIASLWPVNVTEAAFDRHFSATIAKLSRQVNRIVIIGRTPQLRDAVPHCIAADAISACEITPAEYEMQAGSARSFLRSLAREYGNVEYVEVSRFFCGERSCPATKDGYGLFWDSNHVSTTAALAFASEYLAGKGRGMPAQRVDTR